MRVMLVVNGIWGSHGPHMGDEGRVFYFQQNEKGQIVFLVKFPGYDEYHACTPDMVTALISEVMSEVT